MQAQSDHYYSIDQQRQAELENAHRERSATVDNLQAQLNEREARFRLEL